MSQEAIKQQVELIIAGMKLGKIDVEAGQNAMERLHEQMKHEQAMMRAKPALSISPEEISDHSLDAFGYGAAAALKEHNRTRTMKRKPGPWDKLCMRMGWDLVGAAHDRPKLALMEDGGFVFVMGVVNGEHFCIKDDDNLFPSDQVVTQLRLLYNGE